MNIMQIVLNLEYGGLEKLVISLSEGLVKKGLSTCILCLDEKGGLAKEAEDKGIKVFSLNKGAGFDFSMPFKLSEIFKREKIDLVHTHNFGPLIYGSMASKIAGIPCVNTRHDRKHKEINSFIWNINKKIIAVSEDTKAEILKYSSIKEDKIKVIYNGVSVNGETPHPNPSPYPLPINGERERVIGNVARLSAEKDHATLLEAFKKVEKEIKDARLVIAGDGVLKNNLKLKAKNMGLEDKVSFLGMRDDIEELMKTFDVYALSSISEGISLTLLEAMREKKAIVATSVGGNKEVVVDGETGTLVPVGDAEKMAQAIIKVLKDKEMAMSMGKKGFDLVNEKFSLGRMIKEHIELYESISSN